MIRVGPRMLAAVRMCVDGPRARLDVVDAVGPNGSRRYGYHTVRRAVRAGLLSLVRAPLPGRRGATLYVTDAGRAVLR